MCLQVGDLEAREVGSLVQGADLGVGVNSLAVALHRAEMPETETETQVTGAPDRCFRSMWMTTVQRDGQSEVSVKKTDACNKHRHAI